MAARRWQVALVGGLVLALAAFMWWRAGDGPARPAAVTGPTTAAASSSVPVAVDVPRVAIDLLSVPRSEPVDSGRDPFRFGARRRPVESGPSGSSGASGSQGGPPARLAPVEPASPAGPPVPPPPPPIALKFIGLVQKQGTDVKIAVLSDARGVYHGREGDVIEGRYRIVRIGTDTVELMYVDGRGRQVIRLSGA